MVSLQQLRTPRLFGLAIFDLVAGMVGLVIAFAIAWAVAFRQQRLINFVLWAVALTIPVGIAFHVLTGTATTLNYKLGLSGPVKNN